MLTATRARRVQVGLTEPHSPGQLEIVDTPHSMCLLGGGRYGKTEAEVRRINRCMLEDPGVYFWVGLSRPSASYQKAWRMLRDYWTEAIRLGGNDPRRYINKSRHDIELPNGSLLMMRTSENPQSIAGDGPKGVVGDEFTYWPEEVWLRFVQPSLADKDAWCHLIGRPSGENWGMQLWRDAKMRPGWLQRRYTIYDNPLISREVIEDLKQYTPTPIWEQEFMANPKAGSSGVIPLEYWEAAVERWRERDAAGTLRSGNFVLGIDVSEGGEGADLTTFAHRFGWSVAELTDETPAMQGDMVPVADEAERLLEERGGYAIVDSVGVGAMLPGTLRRRKCKAIGFKGSRATKLRDGTGEFGFANTISAAWWNLRELMAPDGPGVALPPDRELMQELTGRKIKPVAGAKYRLEDKDAFKSRYGRSPDKADAVVQAMWERTILRPRSQA